MTPLPAARRLFGDVATRLQVPLSGQPIIRYRQPPASLVRHGRRLPCSHFLLCSPLPEGHLTAGLMRPQTVGCRCVTYFNLTLHLTRARFDRYSIPRGPGEAEDVILRAAAAATVEPAARGDDVIADAGRVLRVGTSPDPSHSGTAVALLRFDLDAAAAASVRRGSDLVSAVLQVHIRGSGTNANNILQVLFALR